MKQHVWFPISRNVQYMFCGRCGLINLKNKKTKKEIKKACGGREDDSKV